MAKVVPKVISLPKAIPQNCGFSKLLLKAAVQSYSSKPLGLPKPAPQSYFPKPLPKVVIEICSGQLLPQAAKAAPENCFRKLFAKVAFESYCPKLPFFKATVRQCCCKAAKLLFKVVTKAASQRNAPKFQRCAPKLPQSWSGKLSKAAHQGCSPKLCPGAAPPKAIPQSGSRKLRHKVATESCSPKLSVKLPPKAAPKKCCSSKQLFCKIVRKLARATPKVAPQSGSPQLLPKASPQSCSPKLRFFKAAVRSCRAKLLLKAAPQSCSCFPKLLHKAVPQSRSPNLLSKAAPNS